jgi:hypothetical protein
MKGKPVACCVTSSRIGTCAVYPITGQITGRRRECDEKYEIHLKDKRNSEITTNMKYETEKA